MAEQGLQAGTGTAPILFGDVRCVPNLSHDWVGLAWEASSQGCLEIRFKHQASLFRVKLTGPDAFMPQSTSRFPAAGVVVPQKALAVQVDAFLPGESLESGELGIGSSGEIFVRVEVARLSGIRDILAVNLRDGSVEEGELQTIAWAGAWRLFLVGPDNALHEIARK